MSLDCWRKSVHPEETHTVMRTFSIQSVRLFNPICLWTCLLWGHPLHHHAAFLDSLVSFILDLYSESGLNYNLATQVCFSRDDLATRNRSQMWELTWIKQQLTWSPLNKSSIGSARETSYYTTVTWSKSSMVSFSFSSVLKTHILLVFFFINNTLGLQSAKSSGMTFF